MRRRVRLPLALAVSLLLAGCGGPGEGSAAGDGPDAGAPVGTPDDDGVLTVHGTDTLAWEPEALEAPAGEVTFELVCGEAVNHNLVVGAGREVVAECRPGESARGSLELAPGEHPFVCTIPGHEARMRGTLTVG